MYYKDMTKYRYGGSKEDSFNIGWLESGKPITKGEVPKEFVEKLWKY